MIPWQSPLHCNTSKWPPSPAMKLLCHFSYNLKVLSSSVYNGRCFFSSFLDVPQCSSFSRPERGLPLQPVHKICRFATAKFLAEQQTKSVTSDSLISTLRRYSIRLSSRMYLLELLVHSNTRPFVYTDLKFKFKLNDKLVSIEPGEREDRHTDVANPTVPPQVPKGKQYSRYFVNLGKGSASQGFWQTTPCTVITALWKATLWTSLVQVPTCTRVGSQHQSQPPREPSSRSPWIVPAWEDMTTNNTA